MPLYALHVVVVALVVEGLATLRNSRRNGMRCRVAAKDKGSFVAI